MESRTPIPAISKKRLLTGRIMTGLVVVFLLWDAVMKLLLVGPVRDSFTELQWPVHLARGLGLLELACVLLALLPRTSVLGTVLLTGYLGGAIATHLRMEAPLFSHTLFPIYVGGLLWGGLVLRDPRIASLLLGPAVPRERDRHADRARHRDGLSQGVPAADRGPHADRPRTARSTWSRGEKSSSESTRRSVATSRRSNRRCRISTPRSTTTSAMICCGSSSSRVIPCSRQRPARRWPCACWAG